MSFFSKLSLAIAKSTICIPLRRLTKVCPRRALRAGFFRLGKEEEEEEEEEEGVEREMGRVTGTGGEEDGGWGDGEGEGSRG